VKVLNSFLFLELVFPRPSNALFGRFDGLLAHHEPHGGEAARGPAARAADSAGLQHHLGVFGAGGDQANELEERQDFGHQEVHDGVELEARPLERVPRRRQRSVPSSNRRWAFGKEVE